MTKYLTTNVTLVLSPEMKILLESWAKNEDRSISAVIRKMIEREAERRAAEAQKEKSNGNH